MNTPILRLRVLPSVPPIDGKQAEFQSTDTHLQWRLVGDEEWQDLIPLADITGPEGAVGPGAEFRIEAGVIEWRNVGDENWNELITVDDLFNPIIVQAEEQRDFAARWASDPEDGDPIDDGTNPPGQSALHWAKKSEGFSDLSQAWATGTNPDGLGSLSAREEADRAGIAAGASEISAQAAAESATTAGEEADRSVQARVNWRGQYNELDTYVANDAVRDAGSVWIAKQETTGNAPPTLPTEQNDYWELYVRRGNDGAAGEGTGDMLAAMYDPQNVGDDAFARSNHTGQQNINTVNGLQTVLDEKIERARVPIDAPAAPSFAHYFDRIPNDFNFSRASPASYTGPDGVLRMAPAGEPRFDYDSETGEFRGLLIEGAERTNLITHSELLNDAYWTTRGIATVARVNTPRLDIHPGAFRLIEDTSTDQRYILRVFSGVPSSTTFTLQCRYKPNSRRFGAMMLDNGGDTYLVRFDFDGGIITELPAGGASGRATLTPLVDGSFLCVITIVFPTARTAVRGTIYFGATTGNDTYAGNGSANIWVGAPQLEVGTVPTSYIPTFGSSVVRSPDVLEAPMGDWIGRDEIAAYFEGAALRATPTNAYSDATLLVFSEAGSGQNEQVDMRMLWGSANPVLSSRIRVGGSNIATVTETITPAVARDGFRLMASFKSADLRASANGSIGSDSAAGWPNFSQITRLRIGVRGSTNNPWFGTLRYLALFPRSMPSPQLTEITERSIARRAEQNTFLSGTINREKLLISSTGWNPVAEPVFGRSTPFTAQFSMGGHFDEIGAAGRNYLWGQMVHMTNPNTAPFTGISAVTQGWKVRAMDATSRQCGDDGDGHSLEVISGQWAAKANVARSSGSPDLTVNRVTWEGSRFCIGNSISGPGIPSGATITEIEKDGRVSTGMHVETVTWTSGGSGLQVGDLLETNVGGVYTRPARVRIINIAGGVISFLVEDPGNYTVAPSGSVSFTKVGGGSTNSLLASLGMITAGEGYPDRIRISANATSTGSGAVAALSADTQGVGILISGSGDGGSDGTGNPNGRGIQFQSYGSAAFLYGINFGPSALRSDGRGLRFSAVNADRAISVESSAFATAAAVWGLSGTGTAEQYRNGTTVVGSVSIGASSTAFNTTSDERLKEFLEATLDAGDVIDDLAGLLSRFKWKATGEESYGVSAQAAHEVLPAMVTPGEGEPDDENFKPWSVDWSKAVPYLIAYCKKLEQRLAVLENQSE